jgi:cytochrome P450/NADPH-cytochrome P450 reductase
MLFFGCRDPERDQLYRDELREFEQRGVATVHTVFSGRPEGGRKHVQDEMLWRKKEVWDLIERDAAIFVCGNASTMAPDVRATLAQIRREQGAGLHEDTEDWIATMRDDGRLVEDIWGG